MFEFFDFSLQDVISNRDLEIGSFMAVKYDLGSIAIGITTHIDTTLKLEMGEHHRMVA